MLDRTETNSCKVRFRPPADSFKAFARCLKIGASAARALRPSWRLFVNPKERKFFENLRKTRQALSRVRASLRACWSMPLSHDRVRYTPIPRAGEKIACQGKGM